MIELMLSNVQNREHKKLGRVQIAFDKKNKVERIFDEDGEDILYADKKDKIEYYRTGTLFLNYLSNNMSEIFERFIDDLKVMNRCELIDKYLKLYLFYFRYLFEDEYKVEHLNNFLEIDEVSQNEIKGLIVSELEILEASKTLYELVDNYKNILNKSKRVVRGNNIKNKLKDIRDVTFVGKFARITRFFIEKAYLKQLYKLIIEYCYFNEKTIECGSNKRNTVTRLHIFKSEYDKLISNTENIINDKIPQLCFLLPPSIITITEDEKIMYCFQIDEIENKELVYTNYFFSISLINLMESDGRIAVCENCNGYFILKKEGTKFCNNISPQTKKQTCSEYMKNKKVQEKIKDNDISSEEKKAYDRMSKHFKSYKGEKYIEKFNEWKRKYNKHKEDYREGTLSRQDYIKWLKKQKIRKS